MTQLKVIIYTHLGCPGSHRAKTFFADHGIEYQEIDLGEHPEGCKELSRMGVFATPCIVVNGRHMVGFDEEEFWQAFRKQSATAGE
ncbi:MAG: glutaredoxin family protein [Thermaerobacterales bacterium]